MILTLLFVVLKAYCDYSVLGNTLSYSISGGNVGNAFEVHSGLGEIKVRGHLDFDLGIRVSNNWHMNVYIPNILIISSPRCVWYQILTRIGELNIFLFNFILDR